MPCPVAGDNYLVEGGGAIGDYYYVLHGSIPVVSTASVEITIADLDKGTDTTSCTQDYSRSLDDVRSSRTQKCISIHFYMSFIFFTTGRHKRL